MPIQHLLPIARPLAVRVRSVRRPFRPSGLVSGRYRLPHGIKDCLVATLQPFRNRDAALTLAVFLARYHSAPGRLGLAFTIDRRALLDHGELSLTEKRIRSAITTLEVIGYLERPLPPSGSSH